jgi:uncharacterized protein (TIGR02391 family)
MADEIDDLILKVLEFYRKHRVDGDTPEVSELGDKLLAFAVRYSLEDEVCEMREAHLPTRSNQQMTVEDANAIIKKLLSLRNKIVPCRAGVREVLHPTIVSVSESRMKSGHYADAVEGAFKELNNAVKDRVRSRLNNELDGKKLMQRVFSPDNPVLLVEGDLDTQTNKDTQQGYMMMFSGAMSAIRNPKAHENMTISKDDAIRKLMFASMLMYKLDAAQLVPVK